MENNTNNTNNTNNMNTKSLWDSEICKQTDEDRKKNPQKYMAMDMKISNMLDHITKHSNIDEVRDAKFIINDLKNKKLNIENLTTRQLGILTRIYGKDWKSQL